jgi:hypothetical protein
VVLESVRAIALNYRDLLTIKGLCAGLCRGFVAMRTGRFRWRNCGRWEFHGAQAREALARMEEGRHLGKLGLTVG